MKSGGKRGGGGGGGGGCSPLQVRYEKCVCVWGGGGGCSSLQVRYEKWGGGGGGGGAVRFRSDTKSGGGGGCSSVLIQKLSGAFVWRTANTEKLMVTILTRGCSSTRSTLSGYATVLPKLHAAGSRPVYADLNDNMRSSKLFLARVIRNEGGKGTTNHRF